MFLAVQSKRQPKRDNTVFSNARPIQKGTKKWGVISLVHRKKLREETLEFLKAKEFCFQHSRIDSKLQERAFTGTPEEVVAFVKAEVPEVYLADVPDTPQGVILTDNHGTGVFQ
ncbi:MAG TPA: hypothetical protein V6C97_01985 [Oculatellaceae cyanobacterium]